MSQYVNVYIVPAVAFLESIAELLKGAKLIKQQLKCSQPDWFKLDIFLILHRLTCTIEKK